MDKKNLNKKIIYVIVFVSTAAVAISFYAGFKYGKAVSVRNGNFSLSGGQQMFGGTGGSRNRTGGGFVGGEIIAKDDKSITVKLQAGGSKIVFFSDSTEITKSVSGLIGDLEIGKNAVITGKQNSDGSLTATTIQLRPQTQFSK